MEVYKVKDYKAFGQHLEKITGCEIKIQIMQDADHYHYQFTKMGLSVGVLCMQQGRASFAPFETLASVKNDQFINLNRFPLFDDLVELLTILRKEFVQDATEEV